MLVAACPPQEVTKKSGGKKGKGKGGKGKGSGGSGSTEEASAAKAKFKACASFFQFFLPDSSSSSKAAVHPAMLPFTPESDEEDEVRRCTCTCMAWCMLLLGDCKRAIIGS
jgi:hypothetical protein